MSDPAESSVVQPKPVPVLRLQASLEEGTKPRQVRAIYLHSPAWYTVHWGDSYKWPGKPTQWTEHTYDKPGTYCVSIVLEGTTKPAAQAWITVREGQYPEVSLVPGDDPRFSDLMYLSLDEPEGDVRESYYDIDWGDGAKTEAVLAKPGLTDIWHGWTKLGSYDVKITDRAMRVTKTITHEVKEPDYDPNFTLEPDPDDPSGMTAKVTVTKVHGSGSTKLNWNDGSATIDIPNTVGHTVTHAYAARDVYPVDMWYPGGGELKYTTKIFDCTEDTA